MMRGFDVRALALGAALAAVAGAASAQQTSTTRPAEAGSPLALSARDVAIQAPTSRIYRSVGSDGAVAFGDRPEPGARLVEIRSFPSSSDPVVAARARRERDYWREQAAAFEQRRAQREREAERERIARSQTSSGQEQWRTERDAWWDWYLTAPDVLRRAPPRRWAGPGGRPPAVAPGPYGPGTAPGPAMGAAAGVPAAFLTSGFATAR